MSTLSDEQLAERERLRQAVLHRWTRQQQTAFAAIWRTWDGYDLLQRTDLPILQLYGDRGREPATHEQLHIPRRDNIELRWLAGASHSLPLERPREVARLIADFMRRHWPDNRGASGVVDIAWARPIQMAGPLAARRAGAWAPVSPKPGAER